MKHIVFIVAACLLFVPIIAVSYSGSFEMSDLLFSTGEEGYDSVIMNGLESISVVGAPQVPVKFINLIIPPGMDVDNLAIVTNPQTLSKPYNLIPVQAQIPTSEDWQPGPFIEPDDAYYTMSVYPPTAAEVVNYGYFDGNGRIATIAIYPLQYMPKSKQIVLNSSIDLNLSFKASSQKAVYPTKRSGYLQEKYNALLGNIVENPNDIQMYYSQPPATGLLPTEADYAIVAPAELIPSFADFISWKAAKGLNIYAKSIEDIVAQYPAGDQVVPGALGINDDADSIRQYLFEQYSQHGLVYALLVGDDTNFPIRYGCAMDEPDENHPIERNYIIPTDLYFSDFSGDWNVNDNEFYGEPADSIDMVAEIFVGRLLAPSLAQNGAQFIENWTEKLITYEGNPGYGADSYLTNAVYAVADQLVYSSDVPQQISLLSSHGFQVNAMIEDPPNGALGTPTGAHVIDQINNGTGIISIYAHGSWCTMAVSTTDWNDYPKHWV